MYVLLGIIVLIFGLRLNLSRFRKNSRSRDRYEKWSCYFVFAILIFLSAFRGENVGADTFDYINDYQQIQNLNFHDIYNLYENYWGFYFATKAISMLGIPLWGWFGLISLLYISSIGRFIFRYSSDKLYSVLLFLALDLFLFSVAGLKQTVAMAMLLHAFLFFTDKKYILSVIFILLAFFSHPTSLLFLVAFILYPLREKKIFPYVVGGLCLLIVMGSINFLSLIITILDNEHFEMYLEEDNSYSAYTLILYILIVLCCIVFSRKHKNKNRLGRFELGMVIISCALQYLALLSPSFFRLSYFFTPFLLSFVPNSFKWQENSWIRILGKYCILAGTLVFLLYSRRNFEFTLMTF